MHDVIDLGAYRAARKRTTLRAVADRPLPPAEEARLREHILQYSNRLAQPWTPDGPEAA